MEAFASELFLPQIKFLSPNYLRKVPSFVAWPSFCESVAPVPTVSFLWKKEKLTPRMIMILASREKRPSDWWRVMNKNEIMY